MAKVYLYDKAYVEKNLIDIRQVKSKYNVRMYNENACAKCEYLPDRHLPEMCDACPNYLGRYRFYSTKVINGKEYVGLPLGDRHNIEEMLKVKKFTFIDKRKVIPFKYTGLKFNTKILRDYQGPAVDALVESEYGVLESAARTGKTPMGSYLSIRLGVKTIIVAHQQDLLEQFYRTYTNDNDDDVIFTNAPKLLAKNKHVVGFCSTLEDFKKYDICLTTYQKFITSKGKKLLNKLKTMFSLLIVDEVHHAPADEYTQVVNKFITRYKFGMTATPDRKDGKYFAVEYTIGPVVHKTEAVNVQPVATIVRTKIKPTRKYKLWINSMKFLAKSEERNEYIARIAKHDVANGHFVLIPVTLSEHVNNLVNEINSISRRKIAAGFHGKLSKGQRKQVLEDARSGKVKVVVGMRSMLTGINVPRWSSIIECVPISNRPKFIQEMSRVCTPMEGKKQPVIRFIVDDWDLVKYCFRNCVNVLREKKIRFSDKSYKHMRKILADLNFSKYEKSEDVSDTSTSNDWKSKKGKRKAPAAAAMKGLFQL